MEQLVTIIQELSLARDTTTVMALVRHAARVLTGADGASIVLREGNQCYYADEEAIGPLWRGQRFPMTACISGWTMLHQEQAIIEDIYSDPRIPAAAYQPTFVHSLVMVPMQTVAPIGALGTYWAQRHQATQEEVMVLQILAHSTAVALDKIHLDTERQRLVREIQHAQHLRRTHTELERFASQAAHDLQEPVQTARMFLRLLQLCLQRGDQAEAQELLSVSLRELGSMEQLIDALLTYARVGQPSLAIAAVACERVFTHVLTMLHERIMAQQAVITHDALPIVQADATHLSRVFQNLLSNALKFHGAQAPRIHVSARREADAWVFAVQDHGIGMAPADTERIFAPFQRLHPRQAYEGTGLGLAICKRIIEAHGGYIWVTSAPGQGTTVFFTIPERARPPARPPTARSASRKKLQQVARDGRKGHNTAST